MNVKILKEDENRLFNRKEVVARIEHKGGATPKRREIRETIGKELRAKPELTVVKAIETLYGVPHSIVEANVYSSRDKMLECEPRYILVRNSLVAEKKEEKEDGKEEEGSEGKGEEGEEGK